MSQAEQKSGSLQVAIVTPTIGSKHLKKCLDSVQQQTYANLIHCVFVDGPQYEKTVDTVLASVTDPAVQIQLTQLGANVGAGGWYGHRVYAACSFLTNADVICYLDEDNWIDPQHVESLVQTLADGKYDWAFSLRKIYNSDGEYLCDDDCESLGKWPVYFNDQTFHIDTSCYAIKREVAVNIGHAWYAQWGADRRFFSVLKQYYPNFECSGIASCCYRLEGNAGSVTKDFFDAGNKEMLKKYTSGFPWKSAK